MVSKPCRRPKGSEQKPVREGRRTGRSWSGGEGVFCSENAPHVPNRGLLLGQGCQKHGCGNTWLFGGVSSALMSGFRGSVGGSAQAMTEHTPTRPFAESQFLLRTSTLWTWGLSRDRLRLPPGPQRVPAPASFFVRWDKNTHQTEDGAHGAFWSLDKSRGRRVCSGALGEAGQRVPPHRHHPALKLHRTAKAGSTAGRTSEGKPRRERQAACVQEGHHSAVTSCPFGIHMEIK